jgi:hypothetical protein
MVTLQLRTAVSYVAVIDGPDVAAFAVRETTPAAAPKPRLLDRVREAIRTRHSWENGVRLGLPMTHCRRRRRAAPNHGLQRTALRAGAETGR